MERSRQWIWTLALLAGCATSSGGAAGGAASSSSDIATAQFNAALGVDLATMTRTASGLYVKDLMPGTGIPATAGDLVGIRYQVSLADGTLISGTGPNDPPFEFRLGRRAVIAGWDEGITGMRIGGRRQLVVPPSLGYGQRRNNNIPPNSILVFNVQLVSIEK